MEYSNSKPNSLLLINRHSPCKIKLKKLYFIYTIINKAVEQMKEEIKKLEELIGEIDFLYQEGVVLSEDDKKLLQALGKTLIEMN